jgi:hypothetical protein
VILNLTVDWFKAKVTFNMFESVQNRTVDIVKLIQRFSMFIKRVSIYSLCTLKFELCKDKPCKLAFKVAELIYRLIGRTRH